MGDSRRGFELHIKFIDRFNTRLVTTINQCPANFHMLQITRAHELVFSVS
jgi:hypothetical protein